MAGTTLHLFSDNMKNKIKGVVFLTGGTGFLGSYLIKKILEDSEVELNLLVRGRDIKESEDRVLGIIKRVFPKLYLRYLPRIRVHCGQLEKPNMGLPSAVLTRLNKRVSQIFHCAATTSFKISKEEGGRINIGGTANVLTFSDSCRELQKFVYVSTTFIAGNRNGVFSEDDFNVGQKFNNFYESSKFQAEALVRRCFNKRHSTLICRPSVIMGDYHSGATTNFEMFYNPLKLFSKDILKEVPANRDTYHNLVPVDMVANAIFTLSMNEWGNNSYHVVSPNATHCGDFMDLAAQYFNYKCPKFIPLTKFDLNRLSSVQKKMIEAYIPYFNYQVEISSVKTARILRKYNFRFPRMGKAFYMRAFKFCKKVGFIKT